MCRILVLLLLSWHVTQLAAASWEADFRKGIKTQEEWLERFRESYDHRILYMLAARRGYIPTLDDCKNIAEQLKARPDQIDPLFTKWGLLRDGEQILAEVDKEWRQVYGDKAYRVDGEHYAFFGTTNDKAYVDLIKYYLEKMYDIYDKSFPFKEKIHGRFLVRIYPDKQSYMKTGAPSFSAAFYLRSNRELASYIPRDRREDQIADSLVASFFHEALHQYMGYYVPHPPPWLNEGFAEFFETALVTKSKITLGQGANKRGTLDRIKQMAKSGPLVPFKELTRYNYDQFYKSKRVSEHYMLAWSFITFLTESGPKSKAIYETVLRGLANCEPNDKVYKDAFGKVDWGNLEKAWGGWAKKKRLSNKRNSYLKFK